MTPDNAGIRERVRDFALWYHTLDLGAAGVTPGWFDLRPIIEKLPWPDVAGKRCLDVGTYDGHLAFEMERRGAKEVIATDIGSHHDWDWMPRARKDGVAALDAIAGEKGGGFYLAKEALGSAVEREVISIYELSPERLGTFDVVVCGSLLLHLRDPFRGLAAIRSVCGGEFMSSEQIDPELTLLHPRRTVAFIDGREGRWMYPNANGHAQMLDMAGFDVLARTKPYSIPYGPSHPRPKLGLRNRVGETLRTRLGGNPGVLHAAVRCRPAAV